FLGKQDAPIFAPRIQCDALDTYPKVWRKVFDKIELTRTVTRGRLSVRVEQETFRATELLGDSEVAPDDVRRALSILSQSALPIGTIDEFDRLSAGTRKPFADTLKTLSDHAVPATVILVGVAESVNSLIEEHQSVERALVQVRMPRMSNAEVVQIVKTGLDKLGMSIQPGALHRIALLSQGLPHYTHLISLYAARQTLDGGGLEITEE